VHRRFAICGLLLAALVCPALVGVALGLHLDWSHHHGHSDHGTPGHDHVEHARLDHGHHSHPPVTQEALDGLLRDSVHRLALDPHASPHSAADAIAPGLRPRGSASVGEDRASPDSSRDTLHHHCTLLL
jgi:hypothetical protein